MARIPMYRMIEEDLLGQIERGDLPRSSQLPSETALAEQYGVSRMTVRQALDRLESARLGVRQHGIGSFVAGTPGPGRRIGRRRAFAEERGRTQRLRFSVVAEVGAAPGEVPEERPFLGVRPERRVVHVD